MPTRLWWQFAGLLLGLQWVMGALLLLVPAFAGRRLVYGLMALVVLGLLWRIGLVFRSECRRLQVSPALRVAEALLLGIATALPAAVAGVWGLPAGPAALRWLAGGVALGADALLSLAGLVLHGWLAWLGVPLLALAAVFVPAGLVAALPAPVIKAQPVALTPPPRPKVPPALTTAAGPQSTWKPVRQVKDVQAERTNTPGRLPPTNQDPPGF